MVYDIYIIYILYIYIIYIYIYLYTIIYSVVNQVNAFIHGLVMVIPIFFVAVLPPLTLYIYTYIDIQYLQKTLGPRSGGPGRPWMC
jgi:hypothetical protein